MMPKKLACSTKYIMCPTWWKISLKRLLLTDESSLQNEFVRKICKTCCSKNFVVRNRPIHASLSTKSKFLSCKNLAECARMQNKTRRLSFQSLLEIISDLKIFINRTRTNFYFRLTTRTYSIWSRTYSMFKIYGQKRTGLTVCRLTVCQKSLLKLFLETK